MNKFFALAIISGLALGCADKKDNKPKPDSLTGGIYSHALDATPGIKTAITVADQDGKAIAGAKVLIGMGLNNPFQGNLVVTDANGAAALPAGWTTQQPVTVHADGYVRVTYFGQNPGGIAFKMKKLAQPPKYELTGTTTGHTIVDNDGFVDFGMTISALTRSDILAFDLSRVISFKADKINFAGGSYNIPSNFSIPKQKESYVVPVSIEKPTYRLFFGEKDTYRIFAAKARFPFKDVLEELQNNSEFYELVNYFTISGGVVRDVNITGDKTLLDLPIAELTFNGKTSFKTPALGANEVVVTVAVANLNDYMIPTDFKKMAANQTVSLSTNAASPTSVISVLKRADEFTKEGSDHFSAVLLPATSGTMAPQYLPMIGLPQVSGNIVKFQKPRTISGVNALATVSIYSEVKDVPWGTTDKRLSFVNRLWEVYSPSWVDQIELPVWPTGSPQPTKKMWEVSYVGSQLKQSTEMGQAVIDAATHVTHSSVSF